MEFAAGFGYRFRKIDLLEEALTHGSYRNDHEVADYERLEFVGDAALGLVVTESMHFQRPAWSSQKRQETKSELVSNQSLAGAARALSLEEGIRVGRGRAAGEAVRSSDRILANVFEAVLGAAYLDGGVPAARAIVRLAFGKKLRQLRLAPPREAPFFRPLGRLIVRLGRRVALRRSPHEKALGYTFAHPTLLRAALDNADRDRQTASRARRGGRRRARDGRRRTRGRNPGKHALRFLGRDVMQLVVADALHTHFPQWDEGRMTLARMRLQEKEFTSGLSRHWSLGTGGEAAGNAEAVMGALYLDGELAAARRALGRPFRKALHDFRDPDLELLDPKTLLQNRLAKEGREAPRYEIRRSREGASRNGEVAVTLRLEGGFVESGRGRGLKEAEKDAARRAFARLYEEEEKDAGLARPGRSAQTAPPKTREPETPEKPTRSDNPKGALQEALVKREGRLPVYRLISESGPEHEKTYVVEVLVGRRRLGRGSGRSKRKAEADAAAAALAAGIG